MNGRVIPIPLVSDEPASDTVEIGLGMQTWADILAGVAVGTEGPFTIGLFAPWGQGKTSVLRRACFVAGFGDNIHTFIVNAWEHERNEDPLNPILEDILRAIDERLTTGEDATKRKRLVALKRILSVLVLGTAAFALGAPSLALLAPGVAGTIESLGKSASDVADSAMKVGDSAIEMCNTEDLGSGFAGTGLRAYLNRAKEQYLPEDKIIVFIDDLDRCHPDKAVLLLESIKHLLWVPGFVFVLALDNEVLERYLQHKYEAEYGLKHDPNIGKRYLEKLVQLTIFLPESEERFNDYVTGLIRLEGGKLRLPSATVPILVAFAKNNPRYVKRRINDLIVDQIAFRAVSGSKDNEDDAVICLSIHRLFRDIFEPRELRTLLANHRLCEEVLNALDGTSTIDAGDIVVTARSGRIPSVGDEDSIKSIVDSLRSHGMEVLFSVLGVGRVWFENQELRQATRAFLVQSRGIDSSVPTDQSELVNEVAMEALGLVPGTPMTPSVRNLVSELDFSNTILGNAGVQEIARFPKIERLNLGSTGISEISPLATLVHLRWLVLAFTSVTDVSSMSNLTELEALNIAGTPVQDISALSSLPNLKSLDLSFTRVTDISPINSFKGLEWLVLWDLQIGDLAALSGLTSLRHLVLDGTLVSNLSDLAGLTELRHLTLAKTGISDVSQLANLFNLRKLDIVGTQVLDVSPLSKLPCLEEVALPSGHLWKPQVEPPPDIAKGS